MRFTAYRIGTMILLYLLATSSGAAQESLRPAQRRMIDVQWTPYGATISGEQLSNPLVLASDAGGTIVMDYGDFAVKSFAFDGALRWRSGKRGDGPREFSAPSSITRGGDGNFWLGDRATGRTFGFNRNGVITFERKLSAVPERVLRRADGKLFVYPGQGATPALYNLKTGLVERNLPLGRIASQANEIVRAYGELVALTDNCVAMAHMYASVVTVFDSTGAVFEMTGPAAQPFPPLKTWNTVGKYSRIGPDPTARNVGKSVFTDGTRIFVQAGPVENAKGEKLGQTYIDVYDPRIRRYVGSFLTPIRAYSSAWSDGTLAILWREPEPTITFWRMMKSIDWDALAKTAR